MTAAFVAGATGYTGRSVVASLRAKGIDTWAHVRPDSPRRAEWTARFEREGARVDSTPWQPDDLSTTLGRIRPDAVFALLGTTRARSRAARERGSVESYETVDLGLTLLLLEATVRAGQRPRFVYLSSIGVAEGVRNPYLAVRWRAESAIRASGLPYSIARPSFITGPDRDEIRLGERGAALVVDGALALAESLGARRLAGRFRSMTGGQLAAALVDLAFDPGAAGAVVEAEQLRRRTTSS